MEENDNEGKEDVENEEKEEEKKQEKVDEHAAPDMIARANEAADRLKRENDRKEALLQKEEALKVEQTLGGKAEIKEPKGNQDSDEDYAKKVMANEIETRAS
jgi:hypothetical protein